MARLDLGPYAPSATNGMSEEKMSGRAPVEVGASGVTCPRGRC
ncbi:MAG: hypothetical protein ABR500_08960 [Dermatophilaceae bacterium]